MTRLYAAVCNVDSILCLNSVQKEVEVMTIVPF